jgi:hypothetical protein
MQIPGLIAARDGKLLGFRGMSKTNSNSKGTSSMRFTKWASVVLSLTLSAFLSGFDSVPQPTRERNSRSAEIPEMFLWSFLRIRRQVLRQHRNRRPLLPVEAAFFILPANHFGGHEGKVRKLTLIQIASSNKSDLTLPFVIRQCPTTPVEILYLGSFLLCAEKMPER